MRLVAFRWISDEVLLAGGGKRSAGGGQGILNGNSSAEKVALSGVIAWIG